MLINPSLLSFPPQLCFCVLNTKPKSQSWKNFMTTVEEDTIYQYLDGKDLLDTTLDERRQLLRKLEQLAKVSQEDSNPERVARLPLVNAQTLLFELSMIDENIDTLVLEINSYAERCGRPRVECIETKLP